MKCKRCGGKRVANAGGKTSDMASVSLGDKEKQGYVPRDMGIGGGDYIEFSYCLDCGQMQGKWPLKETELERGEDE